MINITITTAPPTDPPTIGPRRELELEELVAIGTPAEVVWDGAVVDVVDVDVRGRREIDEETGTGELVANAPWPLATNDGTAVAIGEKFFAATTKASYIACEGGLIAPTIPEAQCNVGDPAPQKNHIGPDTFVISKFHTGVGFEKLLPRPKRPLLKPPGRGIQGSSKDDWVTSWRSPPNTNWTTLFIAASTVVGL